MFLPGKSAARAEVAGFSSPAAYWDDYRTLLRSIMASHKQSSSITGHVCGRFLCNALMIFDDTVHVFILPGVSLYVNACSSLLAIASPADLVFAGCLLDRQSLMPLLATPMH